MARRSGLTLVGAKDTWTGLGSRESSCFQKSITTMGLDRPGGFMYYKYINGLRNVKFLIFFSTPLQPRPIGSINHVSHTLP
jgi:hypothetical protein